jgi:hypothetical protein
VEPLIAQAVLDALSQQELELAVGALEKMNERAAELETQWHKRIEAAQYEADRAARRYYQVEPENRLVARTLEREWNEALLEVECLEKKHESVKSRPPFELTPEQRRKILALANDIPQLWSSPTTKNSQRKQITRLLIDDVTLHNVDVPWSIEVAIRWRSGAVTRCVAQRPRSNPCSTHPDVARRIHDLYSDHDDQQIAEILNQEGHTTGTGQPLTVDRVAYLRQQRGLSRKQRTSEAIRQRIDELAGRHSDAEIAILLNREGKRSASGQLFSDSIIRHVRHHHRLAKQRITSLKRPGDS